MTSRPRSARRTPTVIGAMMVALTVVSTVAVTRDVAIAKDSAAEAQQKAREALKKQQEAIRAAQKAAEEAARRAAELAAQKAAAQRAAQLAAQKAAQQAAAQQAAAQKAAQQAAAQKAAQEAAAQKAAQQAAQKAAQQAAAQKAAQEAAAQKAAQQAAAQKAAQQASSPSKAQTTNVSQPQPTPVNTPTVAPQPVKAPPAPAAQQAPPPAISNDDGGRDPISGATETDAALPNDAHVLQGMPHFGSGDFLKSGRERADGPARPDWAPDPAILNAPRASSSVQHPEPALELAKDLKLQIKDKIDDALASGGASGTPNTAPPAPPASAPAGQPAKGPSRPSGTASQLPMPSRPGEELLATGLTDKQVQVLSSLGVQTQTVTLPSTGTPVQRLRVPQGMSADQLKASLTKQMPLTPFVPNHRFIIFGGAAGDAPKGDVAAQTSCQGDQCFGAELVHWTRSLNECTRDAKVGIIDTSFDTSHPAFRGLKASHGVFLNGEQPSPLDWHGTAVLSELAGHPESGTPGLIPHANFFLAAAFRTDETGNASTDTVRLLSALEWMEALGVQFVNMSFTGPRDDLIEATIRRMSKKGVVFIAAAGNHGPNAPPSYPAAYQDVIAVTAINRKGESYRSANRGSYIDVSAPGVDIPAALPNGRQGLRTGTSFAAPFVTAILAARNPQAGDGKGELLTRMRIADLGPPGRDPIYGAGLALAPEQCGPAVGTVASRPASEGTSTGAAEPAEATMFSPSLSGFSPASGLGFRQ